MSHLDITWFFFLHSFTINCSYKATNHYIWKYFDPLKLFAFIQLINRKKSDFVKFIVLQKVKSEEYIPFWEEFGFAGGTDCLDGISVFLKSHRGKFNLFVNMKFENSIKLS